MNSQAKFNPAEITTPIGLVAAALLVLQAAVLYWLTRAPNSTERTVVGIILSANLIIVIYMMYKAMSNERIDTKLACKLCGQWHFTSISESGKTGEGLSNISFSKGDLHISGTFLSKGDMAGAWETEMYKLKHDRVILHYRLDQVDRGGRETVDGLCVLCFTPNEKIEDMDGYWLTVGREKHNGTVKFIKDNP